MISVRFLRSFSLFLLILIPSVFFAACNGPAGYSVSAVQADATLGSRYLAAGPDSTLTPTPFQPIPPTAIYQPTDIPLPTPTPTLVPEAQAALAGEAVQEFVLPRPKGQVNILLLGSDQRPWDSGFRTDTIILLTLNGDLGKVNLTSFPRDLYVSIPGYGMGRINTAYRYGGFDLLVSTFELNFGVRPEHYVLINFSSFKRIVDSLGGLTVNVGEALSDYRYGYYVTIQPGAVHMDADSVLWYVRSRKTSNDFARNRRQQEVLQAIYEKLLSMDAIKRAPEFYGIYQSSVKTDLGLTDMLTWLPLAAKVAESGELNHYYVGSKQVYDWISPEGGMVLLPDEQGVMGVIRKSQNIP